MSKYLSKLIVGALSLFAISFANAAIYNNGSKSGNFDVTLTIIPDCTISASGMSFGVAQGLLNANVTATSTLSVTCTNTVPYNIGLSAGTGAGSTTATRYMDGALAAGNKVAYNIYQNSGNSTVWGNSQGVDTLSGIGSGTTQSISVYGQIPIQNTPQPDTYKSTITATIYF